MKGRTPKIITLLAVLSIILGICIATAVLSSAKEAGMKFDNLAEYKTAETDMALPLTYEATVYFPEGFSGEGGVIFGSCSDNATSGFNFEIYESGAPRIYVIDGNAVKHEVIFSEVNVYNGAKTHLAITLDLASGKWSCYVNGRLEQTVSSTLGAQPDFNSKFTLGADNLADGSRYFKGELFGVSLYSDARSADEIALDAESAEIDDSDLIAAYSPLSEGMTNITAKGDTKYNITYTCNWIKDLPTPENYAYSFAVIGDIQSMTYYYPDKLIDQFEWIRDNADAHKIAFSVGLGDITEKNTAQEYLKVIEAYDKIDGVVPFSIIRGNHERTSSNDTTMYDTYITRERYGDEITGSYDDTMHNTYRIITIGKVRYMFMNLDLVLSDGAIAWANEIIAAHPECHVIVSTHAYKNMSGTYLQLASTGKFGVENDSIVLWDRLLSQHENIVMVLYGHSPKDTIYKKQREGVNGNIVTEMLVNPSETDKIYGGGGFIAMLYFSEDGKHVDVRNYSTAKNAYYMSASQFSLELGTPDVIEFSNVIMNVGANETERNLTWYATYDAEGEVRYGRSENGKLPENYYTAKATAVKSSKAGYYSYKTTMTGLEANSTYVYQIVAGGVASDCYTFKVNGSGDEFSFAFVTDPQVKEPSHATLWDDTLNKIKSFFSDVSIVVSAGDQTSDPASEDNFDWFTSKHLTSLAIATTVGPPHDNTQLYKDHYNLPNLSTQYGISTPSSDYFYTYGGVLFMHLNVENHDHAGHIAFVENAIADNPDCTWRVVVLHYSFFSGGNHSTDASVTNFRNATAGRFSELGIDLVLSGHDHVYSRSHLMIDGYTVSSDVVKNGTVTDPKGTLYICGTSATGSGWYSIEHHDDDAYIAVSEDANRKSVVIFSVSETSLSMKTYFIDGSTPEEYDSFTINKTKDTVRLDGETEMLEIADGEERIPLVNAYAYVSATVRVVNGYWSVSTNGGASYTSLGIASTDTLHVLRINDSTGYWELSSDSGTTYASLEINARTYTVKYVAINGAAYGDATDLSAISARRFTAITPDAPELWMPVGSMSEGKLYDWSWAYYLEGGDGTPVTSFTYGESYIAYPVARETPIASTIYIGTVSDPDNYTYTWLEAWNIVTRCAGEQITLVLKSDVTLSATDAISIVIPVDLTLDLGGNRLDASALNPALKFAVGSNGSSFRLVTSSKGGVLYAGTNNFIEIGSNQGSALTIQFGSEDTDELTVESVGYLVGANGNFKYTSTLNLYVYGGSYTVAKGVIYVSNVTTSAGTSSPNVYKLTLKDASFSFSGSESAIVRAKAISYRANAASFINADGCTFTDTYKTSHTSSRFLIREDCWYGTASFTDCDFIGMAIGADCNDAALINCGTITIGEGCTFTNSKTTFATGNPITFFSEKVVAADGCVIARTNAAGSAEIISLADAIEITWDNPVGYKDYWKRGTTPAYLGEASFTVGDNTYSLVLRETPTAASENKVYGFASSEGYLYRYNEETRTWQISTNGGTTYTDITENGIAPEEPDAPTVGCTVEIGGVTTTYPPETDFTTVISAINVSANAGKVATITLGSDMSFNTALTFSRKMTIKIDLAGHKLNYDASSRLKTGSNYTLHFYSSLPNGELIFKSGDGIQAGNGTVIFGSEEYKNNLTVNTTGEILNPTQTAAGSTLRFVFLYCTVNAKTFNMMRINAKGDGSINLEVEIEGCTVTGTKSLICYNYTTTLGAGSNGGVCTVDSYIRIKDSTFTAVSDTPIEFFGSANFTDRYFGTVSFEGCTFINYILNGDLIYSDEALSYNTYYNTIKDTGYDPTKAITVGKDCVFYGYGSTFNDDMSGFAASNISIAPDCSIIVSDDHVKITTESFGCKVEVDGQTISFPRGTDFKDVLASFNNSNYSNKEIRITLESDMTVLGTLNFSSAKSYSLIIDLAGHKLTLNAGGRLRFGGVFALNIYSSVAGGELVYTTKDDGIQLDTTGVLVIGSEEYKNMLTVNAVLEMFNVSQIASGSTLTAKYLYTTFNAKSHGIIRLNAKGSGNATFMAEIKGCTVNGSTSVINYNTSSTLGSTSNGGVFNVNSYIKATDSVFNYTGGTNTGFFGTTNFADRYFGTASFEGCTFNGYTLNGDAIYSDEALSYNTYYNTIKDTGYDPTKAITVGKDCVFYAYGNTFKDDMSGFSAGNISIASGYTLMLDGDHVRIVEITAPVAPSIYTATVTIGTNLAMNYIVTIPDGYDTEGIRMVFTMNDIATVVETYEKTESGYVFTFSRLAPQCMGDSIKAELVSKDGTVLDVIESFSVKKYAEYLLDSYKNDRYITALVTDMLNYGAAAQVFKNYKTDSLVNADLGGATSDTTPGADDKQSSCTASTNPGYEFYAVGVRFDYVNKIFLKFNAPSLDGVTILANGSKLEAVSIGNGQYIAYSGAISALKFGEVITFEIKVDGITVQTLTYSVNSYAYVKYNGGDAMGNLALALYRYGASALAYKANRG